MGASTADAASFLNRLPDVDAAICCVER